MWGDRAMGIAMSTVLPATHAGVPVNPAGLTFSPVAADIEAADRIFDRTLAAYRGPFGSLIEHLRHYRGKRLRPALLLLTAKAVGKIAPHHHTLAAAVEM